VHADRDINMFAGRYFQAKAKEIVNVQSDGDINVIAKTSMNFWSKAVLQVKADGSLTIDSQGGSWQGNSSLIFQAGGIDFNGPAAPSVTPPENITVTTMDSTQFSTSEGWTVKEDGLSSIVSRAPTHEPWPYHNQGVDVEIELEPGTPPPPPGAVPVPPGVTITRTQ